MINCKFSLILSYLMLIYTISSIYYLIVTNNIGTPFKDSLNFKQIEIKKKSSNKRKNIFFTGIFIGIIFCFVFKPFHNC